MIPSVEDRLIGVFPVLPTPFHDDLSLDLDGLGSLIDKVLARGVRGLTVLGGLSEALQLSEEERASVVARAVERAAGRATIVGGLIGLGTAVAVEQGRRFKELGAHALLVASPEYRDAPLLQAIEYFTAVVRDVGLPTLYQHSERPPETALAVEDVGELFNAVSLVGIRSALGPGDVALQIRAIGRPTAMFAGRSLDCLACLEGGGVGAMCPIAALMPVTASRLVTEHRAGSDAAAEEAQSRLLLAGPFLAPEASDHSGVKEALVAVGVLRSAAVRGDRPRVSAEKRRQLRELAKSFVEL